MVETQKGIIERFLKEQKKSKRSLAIFLGINENSINRTLNNPNIPISKLKKIADFLEKDVTDLFSNDGSISIQEYPEDYKSDTITLANLSEALKNSTLAIRLMAEKENKISESEKILNLIAQKLLITDN